MYVLCSLLLVPFAMASQGFALSKLWAWFVATPFHLPGINLIQAVGIITLTYLFRAPVTNIQNEKDWGKLPRANKFGRVLGTAIVFPLWILFIGWLVTFFM